jgi:REP element-mobilizing transposase RayT
MREHNRRLHRLPMSVYATTEFEYHFTICARHQGTPFLNDQLAEKIIESLLWTKRRYDWILFCYCLMPDHLHFVCRLTAADVRYINAGARGVVPEGVLEHVGRFKSYTTQQAWKLGIHGELWQKSSYDRVLDWRRPFEEVCWYVLMNPVRKGLVKEPDDWLYSDIVDVW